MSYSLSIHPEAEADVEELALYIGERSLEGMIRWFDAYETAQATLIRNPFQHGYAYEEPILDRGLRQIFFKTKSGNRYRAVYIVDGNQVTILRVRGPSQADLTAEDVPHG